MGDLDFSEFEPVAQDAAATDVGADAAVEVTVEHAEPLVGSYSYRLLSPLLVNGVRLDVVTMRQPEQSDIDDYATGDIVSRRLLLARLTGLDPRVIKKLIWPDSKAVHQILGDLMPDFMME